MATVASAPYQYPDVTFISDLLFSRLDYKLLVSVLVFLQILATFVYAYRRRTIHTFEFPFVLMTLTMATTGWCIVAFVHTTDDRAKRNLALIHKIGAKLYVYGYVLCFALMVTDTWYRFRNTQKQIHFVFFIAVLASYLSCGMFGMLFTMGTDNSWIYEQMIFISFHLAHLMFFCNILQDDCRSAEDSKQFNIFEGVCISQS